MLCALWVTWLCLMCSTVKQNASGNYDFKGKGDWDACKGHGYFLGHDCWDFLTQSEFPIWLTKSSDGLRGHFGQYIVLFNTMAPQNKYWRCSMHVRLFISSLSSPNKSCWFQWMENANDIASDSVYAPLLLAPPSPICLEPAIFNPSVTWDFSPLAIIESFISSEHIQHRDMEMLEISWMTGARWPVKESIRVLIHLHWSLHQHSCQRHACSWRCNTLKECAVDFLSSACFETYHTTQHSRLKQGRWHLTLPLKMSF